MAEIERFDGSIPSPLLKSLDQLIRQKGHQNRSEAIRDLIRGSLAKREGTRSSDRGNNHDCR